MEGGSMEGASMHDNRRGAVETAAEICCAADTSPNRPARLADTNVPRANS